MTDDDIAEAEALLALPGGPDTGRARYGAAMRLWAAGRLSAAEVERFRVSAAHPGPGTPPVSPAARVNLLVGAAMDYLRTLSGPGLAEVMATMAGLSPNVPPDTPTPNPVVGTWLPTALAAMDRPTLAAAIADAAPYLPWITYDAYPPDQIGPVFRRSHAFVTIMSGNDAELGLFLVAPHVLYRDHRHAAPELYAPLTGPHRWRFSPGAALVTKPAHMPVWNPPFQIHATLTGDVPFLCLYAWTRDVSIPAEVVFAPDWAEIERGG